MVKDFDADERRSGFGNRRQIIMQRGEPCGIQFSFDDESTIVEMSMILSGSRDDRRKKERRTLGSGFEIAPVSSLPTKRSSADCAPSCFTPACDHTTCSSEDGQDREW